MPQKKAVLRLGRGILNAFSRFKESSPYTGDHAQKIEKFSSLIGAISKEYDVKRPALYVTNSKGQKSYFDEYLETSMGYYDGFIMLIGMRKFSVLTVLHEFRHHLQYHWEGIKMFSTDKEEDANIWSQAVFKQAFEEKFFELRRQGKLLNTRTVV